MDEKINIQNIIQQLVERYEIAATDADTFVKAVFDLIKEGLETDGIVKIKGLGTFKLINVDRRESIDVNTGERISIDSHTKISFVPDLQMRDLINKPFSHFETVLLNEGVVFDDMPATFPGAVMEEQQPDEPDVMSEYQVADEPETLSPVQEINPLQGETKKTEITEQEPDLVVPEPESVISLAEITEETIEPEISLSESEQSEIEPAESVESDANPVLTETVPDIEEPVLSEQEEETPSLESPEQESFVSRSRVMTFVGVGVAVMLIGIIVGVMYYFYQTNHSVLRLDNLASTAWTDSVTQTILAEDADASVVEKDTAQSVPDVLAPLDTTRTIISGVRKGYESVVPDSTSYRIIGTMTTYQIKRGETLTMVSRRFYETKDLWPYLVMHNRNIIVNPNNVPSGTVIRIPALRDK